MKNKKIFLCTAVSFLSCSAMAPSLQLNEHAHDQSSQQNELAQRVARLHVLSQNPQEINFNEAYDHVQALRRGLYPHEQNGLVKGSSARVVNALDSVLEQAGHVAVEGVRIKSLSLQPSSLSSQDKQLLVSAQVVKFKVLMNSLFNSIDRNGKYFSDELKTSSGQVSVDSKGSVLAFLEACECFAKVTNDDLKLCASCKNCPQEMWCSTCKERVKSSRLKCFLQGLAQETEQRVGVNDALWYLEARLGPTSSAIDKYALGAQAGEWTGFADAKAYADTRRVLVQMAQRYADVDKGIASTSADKLCVETFAQLLETSPEAIYMAETIVQSMHSNNPIQSWLSWAGCKVIDTFQGGATQQLDAAATALPEGMTISEIAKDVQKKARVFLGVNNSDLDVLSHLLRLSSRPLNVLIKDGVEVLHESADDVERFAQVYKKPQREQLLTPALNKKFASLVYAWKTGESESPFLKHYFHGATFVFHPDKNREQARLWFIDRKGLIQRYGQSGWEKVRGSIAPLDLRPVRVNFDYGRFVGKIENLGLKPVGFSFDWSKFCQEHWVPKRTDVLSDSVETEFSSFEGFVGEEGSVEGETLS